METSPRTPCLAPYPTPNAFCSCRCVAPSRCLGAPLLQLASRLQCQLCGATTRSFDPYTMVSLPVPSPAAAAPAPASGAAAATTAPPHGGGVFIRRRRRRRRQTTGGDEGGGGSGGGGASEENSSDEGPSETEAAPFAADLGPNPTAAGLRHWLQVDCLPPYFSKKIHLNLDAFRVKMPVLQYFARCSALQSAYPHPPNPTHAPFAHLSHLSHLSHPPTRPPAITSLGRCAIGSSPDGSPPRAAPALALAPARARAGARAKASRGGGRTCRRWTARRWPRAGWRSAPCARPRGR